MEVEVDNAAAHVTPRTGGWLDKVLPISALFVSFLSILLAWGNGEAMQDLVRQNERLVQASSLPYLQLYGSNVSKDGKPGVSFHIANQGVGPGNIRTAEILVRGQPVDSIPQLLRACCGSGDYSGISTSTIMGRMLRPGETIDYLVLRPGEATAQGVALLDAARQSEMIETRVCFCSVFDECWRASSIEIAVTPVESCPLPAKPYRD